VAPRASWERLPSNKRQLCHATDLEEGEELHSRGHTRAIVKKRQIAIETIVLEKTSSHCKLSRLETTTMTSTNQMGISMLNYFYVLRIKLSIVKKV
jgi:hypothetical protein